MPVWLNGRIVEEEAARIDPRDRGFLLGDGLFETMRAAGGRVPLLRRHLARLRAAAMVLDLPVPLDEPALAQACRSLLALQGLEDAALRLTLSRGCGPRGLLPPEQPAPVLLLVAFPLHPPREPARAALVEGTRRNEHAPTSRLKSLGYLDSILALQEARAAGAGEAILRNTAGRLACAAAANLFVIDRGRLLTPGLEEGVLPGITRGLVLELAPRIGVPVLEVPLEPERLAAAEGLLLTSSLAGIRPVVALDGQPVGCGEPHRLGQHLQALWQAQMGAAFSDF
ncbi:MAG: aminotransferase class IV [Geminicoccaceae bacterium]